MAFQEYSGIRVHPWLKPFRIKFIPGWTSLVLDEFTWNLLKTMKSIGNQVIETESEPFDVMLTTARFGEPMGWRSAPIFNVRKLYHLNRTPAVVTVLHATNQEFNSTIDKLNEGISQPDPDPKMFDFPGLVDQAYHILHEQGRRGGAILALERLLQAQAKSIRIILVVGDRSPEFAYTFDLVGAHPRSDAGNPAEFYRDLTFRLMTFLSTEEITHHRVSERKINRSSWLESKTKSYMINAGYELGNRSFFSEMISIDDLVNVPAVPETIANQYSEGCFASWDPVLRVLITTVTGSARPINKYDLHENDLAAVVGVRPDGLGALVCHIVGSTNSPPSSEAVELIKMDAGLPFITLEGAWVSDFGSLNQDQRQVPVSRSKLHGHRGVIRYDPERVEYISLPETYQYYPVSCASAAQAEAIFTAFTKSTALNHPSDPRQVVFTVLPGHGIVIVEKWVPGKTAFQIIWESIDAGYLELTSSVPQGSFHYSPGQAGHMVLKE